jgi:hypothetical protein
VEEVHTQILILLEEVHDVRFLFREAGTLSQAFPALAPRYRRVLAALRGGVAAMLDRLAARSAIDVDGPAIARLSREMVLGLAFKLAQLDLEADPEPPRARIARAAAEIMAPVRALAT